MTRSLRRAGARWRLLVHEPKGRSFDVTSDETAPARRAALRARLGKAAQEQDVTVLPNTEFDELVVGQAIHIEQMDSGRWWMSIGGVHLDITIDRDGRPTSVHSEGAVDPQPGCTYSLTGGWG